MSGACIATGWICVPPSTREEVPVTSLPVVVADRPLGIVIRNGNSPTRGASIWAYMWAADEEDTPHWHDLVPREHAA